MGLNSKDTSNSCRNEVVSKLFEMHILLQNYFTLFPRYCENHLIKKTVGAKDELLLVTRYYLLVTLYSLLVTFYSLLLTLYSLLVPFYSLLVTTFSLLFMRNVLPEIVSTKYLSHLFKI